MPNVFTEHRLIDATDRTLIKITGTIDGASGQANGVVVDVSTLANAANAQSFIMVANTNPKISYRTSVRKIMADVTGGYVTLAWQQNTSNNTMITLGAGYKEIDFEGTGGLFTNPDANTLNTTGDIVISTLGMVANSAYTIILDLKKDGRDYVTGWATNG